MAVIKCIEMRDLESKASKATTELCDAASGLGLFLLDLRGSELYSVWSGVQQCLELFQKVYDLPLEEKLRYDIDELGSHKLNGYKPAGRNAGVSEDTRDGFEAYLLPRDGICLPTVGDSTLVAPSLILNQRELLVKIMQDAHTICTTILRLLAQAFSYEETHFVQYHRGTVPSTSALGVLKYLPLNEETPLLGHGAHTDVGSLTLLFATGPGLQVGDLDTNTWYDVNPLEGHAIVNLGDSLRFMSEGKLRSCVHRVVPVSAGEQRQAAFGARYSCAYFLRPEYDAPLVDDQGKEWKSIEWHTKKYQTFRSPISAQKKEATMTGKLGQLGLWKN